METRIFSYQPEHLCPMIFGLPLLDPASQPIQACSRDYGFDFDEEELGRELLASLPASQAGYGMPGISAEEFECRFLWFNS